MRFPNPPVGSVSWLGKKRSYESRPISGLRSIVSVRMNDPKLSSKCSRNCLREKNPYVSAIPGSGSFQNGWHQVGSAGFQKRRCVLCPVGLVEICRYEPACLVRQHGIDAVAVVSLRPVLWIQTSEVILDDFFSYWQEVSIVAVATLDPGFSAQPFPAIHFGRRVDSRSFRSACSRIVSDTHLAFL